MELLAIPLHPTGGSYVECGKFELKENVEEKWQEIQRGGRPTGQLPTAALKQGVLDRPAD